MIRPALKVCSGSNPNYCKTQSFELVLRKMRRFYIKINEKSLKILRQIKYVYQIGVPVTKQQFY